LSASTPSRREYGLAAALFSATVLALAFWTYRTWADPIVDFGRELYAAWRVSAGDRLYDDLAWFNGPFSVWWNALWMKLAGVSYRTLLLSNALWLGLALALLYALLRRFTSPLCAQLGGVTFLCVFAFGQYAGIANYNFLSPYSHELTHGFTLSLLALWLAGRPSRHASWMAGLALGAAFLTKPEVFAAGLVATLLRLSLERDGGTPRIISLAQCLAGLVTPPLVTLAFLQSNLESTSALAALAGGWKHASTTDVLEMTFYRRVMGTEQWFYHVDAMIKWSAATGVLVGLVFVLARRAAHAGRALPAAAFVAGTLLAFAPIEWSEVGRVLLIGALCATAANLRRTEDRPDRLAFHVFALALLGKIVFNVRLSHYGFVLALPATLCVLNWLVDGLPRKLAAAPGRRILAGFTLGLGCAFIAAHLQLTAHWIAPKTQRLSSGADALRVDARGELLQRASEYVAQHVPADEPILVLPEGVMLNYLLRRESGTPYLNFMPPEIAFFGEDNMLRSFTRARPGAVVLIHKDTSEYGARFFGQDYGHDIAAWLRANYERARTFGAVPLAGEQFGIAVYTRR